MDIRYTFRGQTVMDAMSRSPGVIEQHVDRKLWRGAEETAREMKRQAPAARSALINSIIARRISLMHFEVTTGVNYARAVHEGTGPAVGKKSYMPNPVRLRDYVKQRRAIIFSAKQGTAARRAQTDEVRDRAWALAMHIRKHGTRPNPFADRTLNKMQPRVQQLGDEGIAEGLREAFGE